MCTYDSCAMRAEPKRLPRGLSMDVESALREPVAPVDAD